MGRFNRILLFLGACLAAGSLAAEDLPLPPMDFGGAMAPPAASMGGQGSQAELLKLQAQLRDLLEQAKGIKESEERLDKQFERLLNSTGVRFGGQAVMHSINFLRLTPKSSALRVWPTVGYFDFKITAKPRPDLQAEVVYRMEKVLGGFWGSLDISGVRYFNMKGSTDIGFEVGMVNYKHTPLTFWVPMDEYEFEPEIQAAKRREGLEEVYVRDNSFPMNGVKLDATLLLFDSLDLDLEAVGFRTAIAGNKNSGLGFAVTFPYDQYLVGGTATFSGAGSKAFTLGSSYFELMESVDTNQSVALTPEQRGNVIGVNTRLALGSVVLELEGAQSNYTPAYASVLTWTTGTGGNGSLAVKFGEDSLKLHGLYVEETFINYAAQSRSQDTLREDSRDQITGNNLYNPRTGDYTLPTVNNLYFTRYNNVVFATNQGPNGGLVVNKFGMQPAAILMTHGVLNNSLPEGMATPNRSGYGADYRGKWFGGLIQPRALGGMYQEIYTAYNVPEITGPRTYVRGGGGVKIDFAPAFGLPLDLQAGGVYEDTRSNSYVAFTSLRLAYDMHWQLSKEFHLLLGFQHADWNGGEFFNFGGSGGSTWTYQDWLVDEYLAGFNWILSKSTEFNVSYAFTDAINADNRSFAPSPNFQNQEYEARLRMRF